MLNNKGFASVVLIIIAVLVLGGGYWMWQKQLGSEASKLAPIDTNIESPVPSTPASPAGGTSVDTASWKTYRNEEYGFEFKYPQDHILQIYSRGHDPYIFEPKAIVKNINLETLIIAKDENEANFYEPVFINMIANGLNEQKLRNPDLKEINFAGKKAYLKVVGLNSEYKTVYLEISAGHWITFENTQISAGALLDQILSTFRFTK